MKSVAELRIEIEKAAACKRNLTEEEATKVLVNIQDMLEENLPW